MLRSAEGSTPFLGAWIPNSSGFQAENSANQPCRPCHDSFGCAYEPKLFIELPSDLRKNIHRSPKNIQGEPQAPRWKPNTRARKPAGSSGGVIGMTQKWAATWWKRVDPCGSRIWRTWAKSCSYGENRKYKFMELDNYWMWWERNELTDMSGTKMPNAFSL